MTTEQIKELISRMTVEEKVSQLTNSAAAVARLGIPQYNWWNEALHGVARAGTATVFPQATALAASFDVDLIGKIGAVIAEEGRAKYNDALRRDDHAQYFGLTYWSPNVNIYRDPRWGRGQETYGEDPYLTSRLGVAFIQNVQQRGGRHLKAAACAKHFAVHSGPENLRHGFDAVVGEKDLRETYLPAFEAAVKEGQVEAVMGAYNAVNGVPCCCNAYLLQEILRGEWGFTGHVVSDCGAVCDIFENHKYVGSYEEAAAAGVKNGCDLNCGDAYERLVDAYEQDLVTEGDLDAALLRLFGTRARLGMLGGTTEFDGIPLSVVACPAHKALSLQAAQDSFVLLKNDGFLPLKKDRIRKLAVLGPNANSYEVLLGNYFGIPTEYSTPYAGIKEYVGDGAEVVTARGCKYFEEDVDAGYSIEKLVKDADAVILCMGLTADYEGEQGDANNPYASGDRADISLPAAQKEFIKTVAAFNPNVILLNFSGGATAFGRDLDHARACVQCWYPGEQGGRAIANLLFGDYSPSGRLPVTFYAGVDQLPDFCDYSMKNRTYRYFAGTPEFPFGFGLSYTAFAYSDLRTEERDGVLTLRVTVTNTGAVAGKETVRLFRSEISPPQNQPLRSLIRFCKVDLQPGEGREVVFTVPAEDSCRYNEQGKKEFLPHGAFRYFTEA